MERTSKTGLYGPAVKNIPVLRETWISTGPVPGQPVPWRRKQQWENPMNGEACRAAATGSQRRRTQPEG